MAHAGLGRPWSITGRGEPGRNADRKILVPGHKPIRIASLIEEHSSYGEGFNSNMLTHDGKELRRRRQFQDLGTHLQQIPNRVHSATSANSILRFKLPDYAN
jgi:hypothetical protein